MLEADGHVEQVEIAVSVERLFTTHHIFMEISVTSATFK